MNTEVRHVDSFQVEALRALFDLPSLRDAFTDELAPLWHWAALARWAPSGETGPDGHPRPTDSELTGLRRMFAGGVVQFHAPTRIGSGLACESRVVDRVTKQGRRGPFTLLTVEFTYRDQETRQVQLTERQDLVYRAPDANAAARPVTLPGDAVSAPLDRLLDRQSDGRWRFAPNPTTLMRFSSATSNGHRIHYDVPYARQVEGYPALVVHGPLMTMSIVLAALVDNGLRSPVEVRHRNLAPLFCGQEAWLLRKDVEGHIESWELVGSEGESHVSVRITWPRRSRF